MYKLLVEQMSLLLQIIVAKESSMLKNPLFLLK